MNSVFSCKNVSARYSAEDPAVIQDISLNIAPGEHVALLGLNGSGKTTLLYAAVGLIHFEGQISVCSIPLSKTTERQVRDNVGFLFGIPDDQILFPCVMDDIAFTLERRGIPRIEAQQKTLPLMRRLGIENLASHSPHRLSHGQIQRVALAGALVANPALLLLDEPSAALDPAGKKDLAGLLASLDAAMLIATHDIEFARLICRRFIVLANGSITEDTCDPEKLPDHWRK